MGYIRVRLQSLAFAVGRCVAATRITNESGTTGRDGEAG
jgi:hypothetical protein